MNLLSSNRDLYRGSHPLASPLVVVDIAHLHPSSSMSMLPHEVDLWFYSWYVLYRGRVETLDAKYI